MDDRELSLAVVGLGFPNPGKGKGNRRFEMALCAPGEPVELRLEPKNPADPYAVAVFSARGVQLGYLTAERAPWIGAKLRNGEDHQAVFQEPSATAAWIRIRFGGGAPTLPQPRPAAPPFDDFEPDPDGPEWGA
ncbi:HIRAN domain-containing protein [Sphingomonas sp.]|uniref:HIRAN domain-containing protein n=1 Tax=Sphingomonas sp. TaxID=28214 RepID=UPI003F6F8110